MSVALRTKQYGVLRAVGLSSRQLARMILSEASTYARTGSFFGTSIGLMLNYLLFSKLVSFNGDDAWRFPSAELLVILTVVMLSVLLAVKKPIQKITRTTIVDTIAS